MIKSALAFLISTYSFFSFLIMIIAEMLIKKHMWKIPNTGEKIASEVKRSHRVNSFAKDTSPPPYISIIIRTLNEERFLEKTLEMVFRQSRKDFEIIIVDSGSKDGTLKIAKKYPVTLVEIPPASFSFGYALNLGARIGKGKILVNISAHALPVSVNWLESLVRNLDKHPEAAGVYGRQLPTPGFCNPIEEKHLLDAYPLKKSIQKNNTFFSNANSAIRRTAWQACPFDENVLGGEDQVWAKGVQGKGFFLVYDPEAAVYHSHNLTCRSAYRRAFLFGSVRSGLEENRRNLSRLDQIIIWWNRIKKTNSFLLAEKKRWQKFYWLIKSPFYEFSIWAGNRDGLMFSESKYSK